MKTPHGGRKALLIHYCQLQQFSRVTSCQLANVVDVVGARSQSSGVDMQWLVESID